MDKSMHCLFSPSDMSKLSIYLVSLDPPMNWADIEHIALRSKVNLPLLSPLLRIRLDTNRFL